MARNQKLTGVIKGRKITSAQSEGDTLTIRFDDGSTMTVRTAAPVGSPTTGVPVKAVRQQNTTLNLDFENGATMEVKTAEATSSVMLRDKNRGLEYAD